MLDFILPALLLGLKHSFDPDHLIAVSNVLTRSGSAKRTIGLTTRWTIGHMGGAALVTAALFLERDSIVGLIASKLDYVVGFMLIAFGALALYQALPRHAHAHRHGGEEHTHPHTHEHGDGEDHSHGHMMGIGLIQGLASNDELLLLLTVFLGLSDIVQMMEGVLVFSIGVFLGMNIFGLLFTHPLVRSRGERVAKAVNLAVGCASLAYGAWMLLRG